MYERAYCLFIVIIILTNLMEQVNTFRVMGPAQGSSSSDTPLGLNSAPKFVTNVTSKTRYRDDLRRWIRVVSQVSEADKKYKGVLNAAGTLIFWACDRNAQDMLKQAEVGGKFCIDGREDDANRTKLVEEVISVIAKETPTDKLRKEVDLLDTIHKCSRATGQTPSEYIVAFNGALARYINETGAVDEKTSRQFSTLMIKNACLPADTLNSLIFQLSTQASIEPSAPQVIKINQEDVLKLVDYVEQTQPLEQEISGLASKVRRVITEEREANELALNINIERTGEAIAQLKITSPDTQSHGATTTMLATRNDKFKPNRKNRGCHACGLPDHYWRDNPECAETMRQRKKAFLKNIRGVEDQTDNEKAQNEPVTNFKKVRKSSFFSSMTNQTGRLTHRIDLNPVLDSGAPTSTAGMNDACKLSNLIGIPFKLDPPKAVYQHGWGVNCSNAKAIVASWRLTVFDVLGQSTTIIFAIVEGDSPIILGLDITRHSTTSVENSDRFVDLNRPTDTKPRKFRTSLSPDESGNERWRLDIAPNPKSTTSSLLTSVGKNPGLNMVKKIHRFTHASAQEMRKLLSDAGILTKELGDLCDKVASECSICSSSGRPLHKKKVSLTHVNAGFNQEVQADFTVAYIKGEKLFIFNIVDMATNYGERAIFHERTAETLMKGFQSLWIYRHGAPKSFSADPEFCRPFFKRFLDEHGVKLNPRPARSSHKKIINGKVERNNGVFKNIFDRIKRDRETVDNNILIDRASFLTNMFHGSDTMSSFQLARGYAPSIVGIPDSVVNSDILDAHIHLSATRALQKVMNSRNTRTVPRHILKPGMLIYVWYDTSAHNIPAEWVLARVIEPLEHSISCRRSNRGPPMNVSYEHVRIAPTSQLTRELLEESIMDLLGAPENAERVLERSHSVSFAETNVVTENENQNENDPPEQTTPETVTIMNEIFGYNQEVPVDDELPPIGTDQVSSFFSSACVGNPKKDIGEETSDGPKDNESLKSSEQSTLNDMFEIIGSEQVTRKKLEFAPEWIINKSEQEEITNSWENAYTEVAEKTVPRSSNIIGSHFVYKIKEEESKKKRLKARLCPHGHRDKEKEDIRNDSSNILFMFVRLLLSIAVFMKFRIGVIDIKSAYLQSGPINRKIYVRPPPGVSKPGVIWELSKLPYGISEAGRQWAKCFESWLLENTCFERIPGVSQLYVQFDDNGSIRALLAKITDDLLIVGDISTMQEFSEQVQSRFKISKSIIDDNIMFNGCEISQKRDGTITMSMETYLERIRFMDDLKKGVSLESKPNSSQVKEYRGLAGELVWLGYGVLPQAAYFGSYMQQRVPYLKVRDLFEAKRILKELKDLQAVVRFETVSTNFPTILTFSDAAFNIGRSQSYAQTGIISGLRFASNSSNDVYHAIEWYSGKQRRISHSSYGAEILACTDADDRGLYIKQCMQYLFPKAAVRHEINVDSKGLYDTITTLHEGRDYRLRQTVQRLRDSFESGELDSIRWVQGRANIADALTKRNPLMHRIVNRICSNGRLTLPPHESFVLDSAEWQ